MIRIKAVYLDGTEQETSAGARVEVEFERRFKVAFSDAFHPRVKGEPRGRQEWQYGLTWASLKIDGQIGDEEFDDWLTRIDTIEVLESSSSEDPTQRDRRTAKSSSSAS